MTIREKAIHILRIVRVPVEPNEYTESLLKNICALLDKRRTK